MFDRIAPRYDFLNRALSLGQDVRWRKRVARHLPKDRPIRLLDLATGTADQILFLLRSGRLQIQEAVGMDLSVQMLDVGRRKVASLGLEGLVELREGDAMGIPAPDASFDALTISFGIRNVLDVSAALREMRRVLRPGGRVAILECSLPSNRVLRRLYLLYFRNVLPVLGGWISGDTSAYRYLNQTVETFPCGEAFCRLLREAGFSDVHAQCLTFGVATIYSGEAGE